MPIDDGKSQTVVHSIRTFRGMTRCSSTKHVEETSSTVVFFVLASRKAASFSSRERDLKRSLVAERWAKMSMSPK